MAYGATESQGYRDEPQLVYKGGVDRKVFRRRLRWAMVAMLASAGVFFMLQLPQIVDAINNDMPDFIPDIVGVLALNLGKIIAGVILLISIARAMVNVVKMMTRKTERMRFFDVGFMWERDGKTHKYNWNAVKTIIEDPHVFRFRKRSLFQWGAITFKMRDGQEFRFHSGHGNMYSLLKRVQPHYAGEISSRMGQLVRGNKSFKVHPQIGVSSVGLTVGGKRQIPWERLNLQHDLQRGQLMINAIDDTGRFHSVGTFKTNQIHNFAAFMELAETTIENTQRSPIYT